MSDLNDLADRVIEACVVGGFKLVTAESCTGGLVAGALTEIPGASAVVERGFVTYSNEAKQEMLGVPPALIDSHGAVSQEVAEAMAAGALAQSRADIALSVTGIAGPASEGSEKPVGLVWFGLAARDSDVSSFHHIFDGDRTAVRSQSVAASLQAILSHIGAQ